MSQMGIRYLLQSLASSRDLYFTSVSGPLLARGFVILLMSRCVLDELVSTYIVFQTTLFDESQFRSYLSRLSLTLEARAYGKTATSSSSQTTNAERSPSRNEDVIWSGNIETKDEPIISIQASKENPAEHVVLTLWNVTIKLSV